MKSILIPRLDTEVLVEQVLGIISGMGSRAQKVLGMYRVAVRWNFVQV